LVTDERVVDPDGCCMVVCKPKVAVASWGNCRAVALRFDKRFARERADYEWGF
jgi:hypothetical protein